MLIGLDVGTSGLKAIAIDPADAGEVVASVTREYALSTPSAGWAEQNPDDYERAAIEALTEIAKKLGARASEVKGIGLSGQMHSSVLLDADLKVTTPALLWCDTRTSVECREIEQKLGTTGLARTSGNAALEGFTLPKLLWLRKHHSEAWRRTRHVLMPKDLVALRLTGSLSSDVSDASGTLAFGPRTRTWSTEILDAFDIDRSLFPDVGESWSAIGSLLPEVATRVGLPTSVIVARGAADNAAGAVGLGVVRAGVGMVSVGTSGVVLATTPSFVVDPTLRLHSFCHANTSGYYVMGVMLAAGGALRWFRDTLAPDWAAQARAAGRDPYDRIFEAVDSSPVGARGTWFLPYLMGERTPHADANARGCFVGMSAVTTREDLARAVVEGITFGLADSLHLIRRLDPPPALRELRATGGGARSSLWRQVMADVFGLDIVTTTSTEGPAFGAAILGGVASGVFASVEQGTDALVKETSRTLADPVRHARYRELHDEFRSLYVALRDRFTVEASLAR